MKIFAISDLHLSFGHNKPMEIFGDKWENYLDKITASWNEKVENEDVVLIAGDISWAMKLEDTKGDFEFLSALKGKIILIRGNHDYWWHGISKVRSILPPNVIALQNDAIKIGKYIICGTRGWTVPEDEALQTAEDKKIFDREVIRLDMALSSAKRLQTENEEIICMMHFPPTNSKRQPSAFTNLIENYGVKNVVFGHLHGSKVRNDLKFNINNVTYYLTSCDIINNNLVNIVE